jgi:hypothetical protein
MEESIVFLHTYNEEPKKWLKEIKEGLNKWKCIHIHRLEDLISLRCIPQIDL